jgi:citrate lyase alpha subunit
MNNDRLLARIDALIDARNTAHDAQQRFADAHVATEPDATSDALYDATVALIDRIDTVILSVEWQNVVMGIDETG